jgi:surfeit locus 1 family protein
MKALFGRKHLPKTALILAMMAVFIRLGVWQLDRLEQRRAANAVLAAQLAAAPVDINQQAGDGVSAELEDRLATATGTFDFSRQVAVTQQANDGRPGVYLVAPLVLDDGEQAILVNRGWIPLDSADLAARAQFDEPGRVTVSGAIQRSERLPSSARSAVSTVDESDQTVFRIDIPALDAWMDEYTLLPVYLLQAPGAGDTLPLGLAQSVDLSEGPHLGYAIQWFAFALIAPLFYLAFMRRSGYL